MRHLYMIQELFSLYFVSHGIPEIMIEAAEAAEES